MRTSLLVVLLTIVAIATLVPAAPTLAWDDAECQDWFDSGNGVHPHCKVCPNGDVVQKNTRCPEPPQYETCSETVVVYGDWNEWHDNGDGREVRERTVTHVDKRDNNHVCSERTEKQYRDKPEEPPLCEVHPEAEECLPPVEPTLPPVVEEEAGPPVRGFVCVDGPQGLWKDFDEVQNGQILEHYGSYYRVVITNNGVDNIYSCEPVHAVATATPCPTCPEEALCEGVGITRYWHANRNEYRYQVLTSTGQLYRDLTLQQAYRTFGSEVTVFEACGVCMQGNTRVVAGVTQVMYGYGHNQSEAENLFLTMGYSPEDAEQMAQNLAHAFYVNRTTVDASMDHIWVPISELQS